MAIASFLTAASDMLCNGRAFGGERFVQRIHSGASESPSKLRLVRARLVLSEYLTFSLQGFLASRQTNSFLGKSSLRTGNQQFPCIVETYTKVVAIMVWVLQGKSSLRTGNHDRKTRPGLGGALAAAPVQHPAEHACVWRRSVCATSGLQEPSSEHGCGLEPAASLAASCEL
eukprot:scaffold12811_cov77-Phaeocystis_antarctica.AAC.1